MSHDEGCCCPHHRVDETVRRPSVWLLALLAAVAPVAGACGAHGDVTDSLNVAVTVRVGAPVFGWVLVQLVGEWRLSRLYDRPVRVVTRERAAPPAALPRAIESVRPVVPLVIDVDGGGRSGGERRRGACQRMGRCSTEKLLQLTMRSDFPDEVRADDHEVVGGNRFR
jgi:hypothetical protein